MPDSKEILVLADAINTAFEACAESKVGKVATKIDDSKIGDDPRNLIINQVALATFGIILKEKLRGVYQKQKEVYDA